MTKIIDEIAVQVSVEAILQKALIETAESILKEHGTRLNYVNFEWLNVSTASEVIMKVDNCEVNTTFYNR